MYMYIIVKENRKTTRNKRKKDMKEGSKLTDSVLSI